jgi:hypothetical protein
MKTLSKNKLETLQQKINDLQFLLEEYQIKIAQLESILPKLIKNLAEVNLTVNLEDIVYSLPEEKNITLINKKLSVCVFAQPTEKFKFLTFNGYLKTGESKNYLARERKAKKLQKKIKQDIPEIKDLQVNGFSLEVKENQTKSVFFEFLI